jgi:anti-sigma B factor antagonist
MGDLGACSSLAVYYAFEEACKGGRKFIMINCQELNYLSSAGLGVFMSHLPHFKQNGTNLVLYHVKAKIKSVFKILV